MTPDQIQRIIYALFVTAPLFALLEITLTGISKRFVLARRERTHSILGALIAAAIRQNLLPDKPIGLCTHIAASKFWNIVFTWFAEWWRQTDAVVHEKELLEVSNLMEKYSKEQAKDMKELEKMAVELLGWLEGQKAA